MYLCQYTIEDIWSECPRLIDLQLCRMVCKEWRDKIPVVKLCVPEFLEHHVVETGSAELVHLFIKWELMNSYRVLNAAAKCGYEQICHIVRFHHLCVFEDMLMSAAIGGHVRLCHLARRWDERSGGKRTLGKSSWTSMAYYAALNGHEDVYRLAIKWGADPPSFPVKSCQ